ncbi:MAG: MFS transporter [Bacillota bacterium]
MNLSKCFQKKNILHYIGHAYNDIYFLILPLLLPFIKSEFNLNYFQSGLILTSHIGIRSLFSYISGHLGDKYDKRIIISFGFVFSSIFMAGLVLANTYTTVFISLFIMGIGVAAFHPLATALVGEEAESEHRAFQIGIFETIGASGIIIASITFGFFVGNWGWRQTCLVLAVPGLPLALAYLRMRKEEIDNKMKAEEKVDRYYILSFILGRGIRALGMGAVVSFLPTYAEEYMGLTGGAASWTMTLYFAGIIIGNLGGGWIADNKTPLLMIAYSTFSTIFVLLGITYIQVTGIALFLITILGISHGGFFTPQNSWLTTVSTQSTRGKIMGAAFFIDGISVTLAPTIFGWVADQVGLDGSFKWMIVPVAVSVIIFFRLYYLENKDELSYRNSLLETVSNN